MRNCYACFTRNAEESQANTFCPLQHVIDSFGRWHSPTLDPWDVIQTVDSVYKKTQNCLHILYQHTVLSYSPPLQKNWRYNIFETSKDFLRLLDQIDQCDVLQIESVHIS